MDNKRKKEEYERDNKEDTEKLDTAAVIFVDNTKEGGLAKDN